MSPADRPASSPNAGPLLAIDIGNTRLKWALFDSARPEAPSLAHGAEFLEHIDKLAEGPWAALPHPRRMLGCVVAGEAVRRRVEEQMEIWDCSPRWVVPSAAEAGLTNGYDHPTRLGADRWVALVAAHRERATNQLVVNAGTALTVDALAADGRFLGGVIAPGVQLMREALVGG
ncbi:MAG: type III pantothenate kinase, partial [Burkholderiaceae bacterium]